SFGYQYDALGRLTGASSAGVQVTLTYDYAGRRISKRVVSGSGTTLTNYVYDGNELIAEFDGLTGKMTKSYVWDPRAYEGVGGLLMMSTYTYNTSGTATQHDYRVISNQHGDVTAMVDSSGAVVETYSYSVLGVR